MEFVIFILILMFMATPAFASDYSDGFSVYYDDGFKCALYGMDGETDEFVDRLNKMLGTQITIQITDQVSEIIPKDRMREFINYDQDINSIGVNSDAVYDYVAEFVRRYNTKGELMFTTYYGEEVKVPSTVTGWRVDTTGMQEAIERALETSEDSEIKVRVIDINTTQPALPEVRNNTLGETYVEVSLSSQHMWVWSNGEVIFESDVVTGLPKGNRETPRGYWKIINKAQNTRLIGSTWNVGVARWMKFTASGCGFHDATWQSSFGGSRYKTHGSHGCVNMPLDKAKELYGLLPVGTAVIVY